jgi:hypothetical protein
MVCLTRCLASNSRILVMSGHAVPLPFLTDAGDTVTVSSAFYELYFSPASGRLEKVFNLATGSAHSVFQNLLQYTGAVSGQASGAYVFNPGPSNR